ncbi:ABC transporter substrate-binding protein [Microbacterium sp. RD1]|uniref:ABC transporter substrate-binding protein n=1 Tax=Microbacterium sp. RD1 TaxID=3457313 RepID=UPI003FA60919
MAIAAAAALVLAGCAAGGDNAGSEGEGAGEATGEPLVVAMPLPLTSGNATTAEQIVNSAELAIQEINANGGAGGRPLELKVYDDLLTADESAKVTQRALTVDGAEIVVGAYTTIEGLAIRQLTDPREIIFMSPSTISPALTDGSEYVFRTTHIQDDYPELMAQAASDLGLEKVVVLHDDSPTGSTLWQPTNDALEAAGIEAGTEVGYAINSTDVSTAIAAVKAQDPDGVILIGSSAADAGLDIKTMYEQGLVVPVIGFSSPVAADAIRIGGEAYENVPVYSIQNKQPDKALYTEFAEKYAEEYGGTAEEWAGTLPEPAAATYDAFMILKNALDATEGDTDGDKLRDWLVAMEPYESVAGKDGATISWENGPEGFSGQMATLKYDPETGYLVTLEK